MIDCGEGTQAQVRRSHINFSKLQAVFISHIHGDHVFGLMGMISTFGLQGRTAPLHVYAPEGYEALFHAEMQMFCSTIDYEVIFHPVDTSVRQVIFEDRSLTVETIPLKHRMPCAGFLFKEKQGERHINPKALEFYNVPRSQINNLRAGLDWTSPEGELIPNDKLTTPPDPVRSYAYCSDTRYMQSLGKDLSGVTMLYHEATYGEDMKDNAMVVIEPPSIDPRIVNQYSFFSIVPNGIEDVEVFLDKYTNNTIKYVIPKELRWRIRDMLDGQNVSERMFFPGLDGLSCWLGRHYFVK